MWWKEHSSVWTEERYKRSSLIIVYVIVSRYSLAYRYLMRCFQLTYLFRNMFKNWWHSWIHCNLYTSLNMSQICHILSPVLKEQCIVIKSISKQSLRYIGFMVNENKSTVSSRTFVNVWTKWTARVLKSIWKVFFLLCTKYIQQWSILYLVYRKS